LFKLCSTTTPNGIATVAYFFGTIPQRFAFSLPQLRELRLQKSIEIFEEVILCLKFSCSIPLVFAFLRKFV